MAEGNKILSRNFACVTETPTNNRDQAALRLKWKRSREQINGKGYMKIITQGAILVAAVALTSATQSFAVVDQTLQVQGTNLVLSWPSTGTEYYMIQFRPALDPGVSWMQLTNNYHANSTNRTTFIVPCCVLADLVAQSGWSNTAAFFGGDQEMALSSSIESESQSSTELWAVPKDGSGSAVPLAIYPPGYPTNDLIIFEVEKPQTRLGARSNSESENESNGPMGISNGGCNCPDMGFFRVWHIPDWAFNITNYTYDESWFLPVDFKDYRDRVESVQVLINGEVSPYAEFTSFDASGTNWGIGFDFDRLTNGTYQIQLLSTLHLDDSTGDSAAYIVLSNLTRSIVVSNQAEFSSWNDFIQGDTYTFNAKLANTNTDWSIDIYDVSQNYVNTGSGHTTNGQISWTWDLKDFSGNSVDDFSSNPYFYSVITIIPTNALPTEVLTPPVVQGYPDRGEWLITFQDRWLNDTTAYPGGQSKYENAMSLNFGGPTLIGDQAWYYPLKFGTNYTYADREYTWTNLISSWMGDLYIRNFYYHGHGGATSLGCDKHTFNTNGLVTGGVFSFPGSRSQMQNWQIAQKTKYKRFRFVFLDGCSTAAGDLPNAFNVSKTNHTIDFYENHPQHPRPSVFVGWIQIVGGEPGTDFNKWLDFEQNWMGIWANSGPTKTIKESIEDANRIFGWLDSGTFNNKIRFYGYQEMTIRSYNGKGDWRWP